MVNQSPRMVSRPARAVNRPAGVVSRPAGAVRRPAGAVSRPAGTVSRPAGVVSRPGWGCESSGCGGESSGSHDKSSSSHGQSSDARAESSSVLVTSSDSPGELAACLAELRRSQMHAGGFQLKWVIALRIHRIAPERWRLAGWSGACPERSRRVSPPIWQDSIQFLATPSAAATSWDRGSASLIRNVTGDDSSADYADERRWKTVSSVVLRVRPLW
jgi:hypothetical protein